ncbi:MAG TPA: hypothetical protein VN805_08930 [Caulobacteraceae bacterium]|nr:hypothetical protein [Caulobacteraceae bacterium]
MPPRMVALGLAAIALYLAPAAAANAQQAAPAASSAQVVSTASGAPPPAPAKADDQIAQWLADTSNDDTPQTAPVRDHKVHGQISFGVGTNRYREVGGIVTGPLGDDGQATVAIDAGQIGAARR